MVSSESDMTGMGQKILQPSSSEAQGHGCVRRSTLGMSFSVGLPRSNFPDMLHDMAAHFPFRLNAIDILECARVHEIQLRFGCLILTFEDSALENE